MLVVRREFVAAAGIVLLAWRLLAATTAPATAPKTFTDADIHKLVTQLASDKFVERETAQDRLVAQGPGVVGLLEPLLAKATDEEVRTRLQSILRQINRADIEHPTLVTLHMKDAPAKEILAELARQGDTQFVTTPDTLLDSLTTRHTIDADHEPFWKVALDVCRQAHLTPAETGGAIGVRTIALQKGAEPKALADPVLTGCFHITPVTATHGGTVANRTILSFRMLVDPKLTVLRSTTFIRTAAVTDAAGKSLLFNAPFSPDDFTTYYNYHWSITSHIFTPAAGPVATFKGSVRMQVLEKSLRWEIDQPLTAKNVVHDLPVGKGTFEECAIVPLNQRNFVLYDLFAVKTTLDITPGQEAQLGGKTILGGNIRAWDDAGHATPAAYFGSAVLKDGHVDLRATLQATSEDKKNRLGAITKLVWEIPVGVKEIPIAFEFNNITVK